MDRLERQPVDLEALSAYLDGELSETERAAVEAHLAADPAWQAELNSLRWSVALMRDTPDAALPRSFELPVPAGTPALQAEAADSMRRTWSWIYGALRASAAAAALLLVVVVAADVFGNFQTAQPAATSAQALPPAAAQSAPAAAQAPAPAGGQASGSAGSGGGPAAQSQPAEPPKAAAPAAPKSAAPLGTAPAPAPAAAAAAQAAQAPPAADTRQKSPESAQQPSANQTPTPAPRSAALAAPSPTLPDIAARSARQPGVQPSGAETIPVLNINPAPQPAPAFPWRALEIALAALVAGLIAAAWLARRRL